MPRSVHLTPGSAAVRSAVCCNRLLDGCLKTSYLMYVAEGSTEYGEKSLDLVPTQTEVAMGAYHIENQPDGTLPKSLDPKHVVGIVYVPTATVLRSNMKENSARVTANWAKTDDFCIHLVWKTLSEFLCHCP